MSLARRFVFLVYPGVQLLDMVGPFEIFAAANELFARRGRARPYELVVASADGAAARSSAGLPIAAQLRFSAVRGPIHTLLVPGSLDVDGMLGSPGLVSTAARLAARATRVVSVCSGAFVLARAGVLAGKRATTHWAGCARLAAEFPDIEVLPDPIFVCDGKIVTSAGVTAGMDLALALVEQDIGKDVALELARWFVMYLRRPGGQSQFSVHLDVQIADREPIREVVRWIEEHPGAELGVEVLARRSRMSPRHFARVFGAQVGATPARFVARLRLEAARRRLEESADPLKLIAHRCGFGTIESLRRAFQLELGVSPGEYRRRFRRAVSV